MDGRKAEKKIRLQYLVFSERQAWRLIEILRQAAITEEHVEDADKWRDVAKQLVEKSNYPRTYRRWMQRPKEDDPVAVKRVLKNDHPLPVLSHTDARKVFMLLDAEGKSAREIAERLHVGARTIVHWRRQRRNGEWEGIYE
jgi:DNA-directed RNA polymerase specialized sigma24 family protein